MKLTKNGRYIPQLNYPGSFFDTDDLELDQELDGIKSVIESNLLEAAYCLNQYEEKKKDEEYNANQSARTALLKERINNGYSIRDKYLAEKHFTLLSKLTWKEECEIRSLDEEMYYEKGLLPNRYLHQQQFFYANNFALAIDRLFSALKTLSLNKYQSISSDFRRLKKAIKIIDSLFSDANKVRDSISHPEDRKRMLDSKGNKIVESVEKMPANYSSVTYSSSLLGDKLTYTTSKNKHSQIEVSIKTLERVESIVQEVIECIKWKYIQPNCFP